MADATIAELRSAHLSQDQLLSKAKELEQQQRAQLDHISSQLEAKSKDLHVMRLAHDAAQQQLVEQAELLHHADASMEDLRRQNEELVQPPG